MDADTRPAPATPADPPLREPGAARAASTLAFERAELAGTVVERLARVAARFPTHDAVVSDRQRWTYAAFEARTNQVATAIVDRVRLGEGCVAYLVGHAPEMVLCALAAIKAGKAYLCVHPGWPPAAGRDVIAHAVPDLLVCDRSSEPAGREMAHGVCDVLVLEEVDGRYSTEAPAGVAIDARDPAAIYYTSGSTGRPKGVVKSHRALLHRAWLCREYDAVNAADRQSLLTFCSFASSEADVFGGLLNGAAVEVFDVASRGLAAFGAWIDARRITLLHPPVLLFRRYLATLGGAGLHPSVRLVALAGEAVMASDVREWRRRFSGGCALRHRFSSTEAGHVAVAVVGPATGSAVLAGATAAVAADTADLPPARAVADKELLVVDEQGRPVPAGEAGELLVGSAFLADGYWRRPAETAAGFPEDPRHPSRRHFRTGDMGRLLADGAFEFLGRRDHQVKVRGYRVELREVEQALLALPGVKEVAVIAERAGDETRLVGFAVMRDGHVVTDGPAAALRAEMRLALPEWKVPARIHVVDALPLTLTGKVDRQVLGQFDNAARGDARPPEDAVATRAGASDLLVAELATIWEALLSGIKVGPDDDFFELGGHSLLAAQLLHRVGQRFGRSLTPGDLVGAPTVRRLAELIRSPADESGPAPGAVAVGRDPAVVSLKASGCWPPLFCVPVVGGSALTYVPLARRLSADQPVYALELPQGSDGGFTVESVGQVARWMVGHVRRVCPRGPYRLCGHSFGAVLAYEMARQLGAAGGRVELLAMLDGRVPGSRRLLPLHRRLPLHLHRLAGGGARQGMSYLADRVRRIARRAMLVGDRCMETGQSGGAARVPGAERQAALRRALRAYRPPPYPGTVTLFRAAVPPAGSQFNVPEPMNGWDGCAARVEVLPIPGDHLTILHEPNLTVLAAALDERLARLSGAGGCASPA
jgi:amino acid adenylation domain-containing protein